MKVDYIALSVPVFFFLIGIELCYNFYNKLDYYRLNDSISNISQGIGQQLTGIFMKGVLFFSYRYIFEHWGFFNLPDSAWTWLVLFIGVDFFYYWFHRMSHQVNALWAAHIVHHQSEEYNLTVALRQSWFQGWFSWVFYLPLALIGFDPILFLTLSAFNTLYQFWIHTRAIKSLGIFEYVFNTPAHHRVHHGSNPKYIDKNHAGTLIVWDRLFGTFQKEEEPVYYGITKPLNSWNPVWANLHYWDELIQTSRRTTRLSDKIMVFLKSPGWFPVDGGDSESAPVVHLEHHEKYDPQYVQGFGQYAVAQFILALLAGSAILVSYHSMETFALFSATAFTIISLINCGALLEQKQWLQKFEFGRLCAGIILILYFKFPVGFQIIFTGIQLASMIWFYNLQKTNFRPDED